MKDNRYQKKRMDSTFYLSALLLMRFFIPYPGNDKNSHPDCDIFFPSLFSPLSKEE